MKSKPNKKIKYLAYLSAFVCLFVAEGQRTTIQNVDNFKVKIRHMPGADNLVKCWSTTDLKKWELDAFFLGSDGEIEIYHPIAGSDTPQKMFFRFEETVLTEARNEDTDDDGFDDVYEVMHKDEGLDPLVPDLVEIASILVSKEAIAAGAVESELHQSEVTLQLSSAGSYPVKVWLCSDTVGGTQHSPAKITWNDQVGFASAEESGEQVIDLMTDVNGAAILRLTSSNVINESCVVHARVGTIYQSESQAESAPVQFEQGDLTFRLPPRRLVGGSTTTAEVQLTYKGAPLPGHDIALLVNEASIYGTNQEVDPANPDVLDSYVTILSDHLMRTDEEGKCSFEIYVAETEGLNRLGLTAINESQFFEE